MDDAPRLALHVLALFLRRNGAVYTLDHIEAVLYDELEEIPTRMATRKAVERARRVLERAGWPVTIRTEYGIGYSVSWPHKWTMPA